MLFIAQCTLVQSLSVQGRQSVTLVDCDHIGWKCSILITQIISRTHSLFVAKRRSPYSQGNEGKFLGD